MKICKNYEVKPKNKILRLFALFGNCSYLKEIRGEHFEISWVQKEPWECPFQPICKHYEK